MKLKYNYGTASFLASLEFAEEREKRGDRITAIVTMIAVGIMILTLLTACQLPSVTVHGQYGDYSFKPRQPITIESAKE